MHQPLHSYLFNLSGSFAEGLRNLGLAVLVLTIGFPAFCWGTPSLQSDTTSKVCSISGANSYSLSINGLSGSPADSATLTFYFQGDLNSSSETFELRDEQGGVLATDNDPGQCSSTLDSVEVRLAASRVAGWLADGQINFTVQSSSGVGTFCGLSCAQVKLTYPATTAPLDGGVGGGIKLPTRTCSASQSVEAEIFNYGSQTINSLSLQWSVNGVQQSTVSYSGTLDTLGSGAASDTVTLGTYSFMSGQQYQVKIWTKLPNGQNDTVNFNDTLSYVVYGGLNGAYTIGGSNPDFSSWAAAAQALQQQGVCGPTQLTVRPGTYTEQFSIDSIPGASAQDTVVFMSQGMDTSQVTLQHSSSSSANYLIRINGADHLRFAGITFQAQNSYYSRIFSLNGFLEDLIVAQNHFKAPLSTSTSTRRRHIYSDNLERAVSLSFFGNTFRGGSGALYLRSNNQGRELNFSQNKILNASSDGLYVDDVNRVSVSENTLEYTSLSSTSTDAIRLEYCDSALSIRQNIIRGADGGFGIYLRYCEASSAQPSLVSNNFIQVGTGSSSSRGIYTYYSDHVNLVYNTVRVTSQSTYNRAFQAFNGSGNRLLNNNLTAESGLALEVRGSSTFQNIDYNNYYSPDKTWAEYQNTGISDLSALQGQSSDDAHSLHVRPFFLNDSGWEVGQVSLNKAGTPLGYALSDIEGDSRSASTPDIGADEFTPSGSDAGIVDLIVPQTPFAPGSYPVQAVLKNFGGSSLSSATVDWEYNGQNQSSVSFSGSLSSGDTAWVSLGTINFNSGDSASFRAYSSNPNGISDPLGINDTSSLGPIAAALGGHYTIGGSSPDYGSFQSATAAMQLGGTYAPVHFAVRSGTYSEQIAIDSFPKAQVTDSVHFYGEAGDSSAVVWTTSNATFNDRYVLKLSNVDEFYLEDMTLQNASNSYRQVVVIEDGCKQLHFKRMVLENNASTSTSPNANLVYGTGLEEVTGIYFDQVQFNRGAEALYLDGGFPNMKDVEVTRCRFEDFYETGIYIRDADSVRVLHNYVETQAAVSYSEGIYLSDIRELSLLNNQVYGWAALEQGIYLDDLFGGSTDSNLVANNMVSMGGNARGANGIYTYDINYTELSHNSVWFYGTEANAEAFYYGYSGTNNHFYNNIFQNTGGGYAIYVASTNGWTQSDHNNLHTTGSSLAYWSGSDQADLAGWQNASSKGAQSISQNAQFLDTTDLHTSNANLNAAGIPRPAVSLDIDGQSRDVSTPDIGADEFTIAADDAGLLALQAPVKPFSDGLQDVKVKLLNNGSAALDSVNLYWMVNGQAQDTTTWRGSLPSGNSLDSVLLGSYNFQIGQAYKLKVYVGQPNGNPDANPANDTLESDSLYPALQGYYTIGQNSADFPSIGSADTALQQGGIAGWVSFGLQAGTYTEKLVLEQVTGASVTDTITFRAANGDSSSVTWTSSGTSTENYLLRLDDAHHFRFKDLKMRNTSTSYPRVVVIDSASSNLDFVQVDFGSSLIGGYGSSDALVDVKDDFQHSHLTWEKCTFRNGAYGIFLDAAYNSGNFASGNVVEDCQFLYQGEEALYARYQQNLQVRKNTFRGEESDYFAAYIDDNDGLDFYANRIYVENGYGLRLRDPDGSSSDSSRVSNNLIVLSGSSGRYGIRCYSADYTSIAYNTVRMHSTSSSSRAFEDRYNGSNARVYNNIFHHHGGGLAMDVISTSNNALTDYNNYYSTGPDLIEYGSNRVPDLAGLQSSTGEDANSLQVDPGFQDSTGAEMSSATLDAAALPLAAVTTDITGANRASEPDIGAYEYSPPANDVAVEAIVGPERPFASGTNTVYLRILNNGADTLRNFTVEWSVNGASQSSYSWSGQLASGQMLDSVPIGSYSFQTGVYHEIEAIGEFPNGQSDARSANDTARIDSLYPALSGGYTIGANSADFPTFTAAALALQRGGMLSSVLFSIQDGTYQENISLGSIVGNTAQDTLVFQSLNQDSARVTLSNATSDALISLDGPKYLTFSDLTLKHSGGRIIHVKGPSDHIRIRQVHFVQDPSATSSSHVGLDIEYQNAHDSISVFRSQFDYGGYGIHGDAPYNDRTQHFMLQQSTFQEQNYAGVSLEHFDNSTLSRNEINKQGYSNTYEGFDLIDIDHLELTGNRVFAAGGHRAIRLYDVDGTSNNPILVANNFVAALDSSSNNGIAVEIDNSNFLHFYHNTLLHGNAPSDGGGEALRLETNGDLEVVNNIIASYGGGYALQVYNFSQFNALDHNVYYRPGLDPFTDGTDYDLAAWQSASSFDANSQIANPLFASFYDLHIRQSSIDSSGTPLASVLRDIDGELRSSTHPDPGADEVILFPDDLTVLALLEPTSDCDQPDSTQVQVAFQNLGSNAQSNFDLVVGLPSDTLRYSYAQSLAGGQKDTVTFTGYLPLNNIGSYDYLVWVEPQTDVNAANDTLRETIFHYASPQLGLTNDTTICRGSTARLQASGGSNYQWSTGAQGTFITVQPDSTTTYIVTLTNVNGCQVSDSVLVTVDQPADTASLQVAGNNVICGGDSVLLVSSNSQNIRWSTGSQDDSLYVKTPGSYQLLLDDPGSSCDGKVLGSASVSLSIDSIRVAGNGQRTVCAGDPVTLETQNWTSGTWGNGDPGSSLTIRPQADTVVTATWSNSLGCTFSDQITIRVLPAVPPAAPGNLFPADSSVNLSTPINTSWSPASNATRYDLYFWKVGSGRSNYAQKSNLSSIQTSLSSLQPNQTYYWQVAARNSCFSTFSDTNQFTTVGKPDLVVDSIAIPQQSFSGTNVSITYRVRNIGTQSTGSRSWNDYIWLSSDVDLRIGDDDLLLKVPNQTYLDTGQSYINTVTVQLPQQVLSTQLLFVSADNNDAYCATSGWQCYPGAPRRSHSSGMAELIEPDNNFAYDTLTITPSPLPDIQIANVGLPSSAFSGDAITINYDVLNDGNQRADIYGMRECFFISTDSIFNQNAVQLQSGKTSYFTSTSSSSTTSSGGGGGSTSTSSSTTMIVSTPDSIIVLPDSTKSRDFKAQLPQNIFGKYYIHIVGDCNGKVFEGFDEGNNNAVRSMDITLTPPADLIVDTAYAGDTVQSGGQLPVAFSVINQGSGSPTSWTDSIYLCSTPTFNPDSVIASDSRYYSNTLVSGGTTSGSTSSGGGGSTSYSTTYLGASGYTLSIPNGLSGTYYLFVKADAKDDIYEYNKEGNNRSRAVDPVVVELAPPVDLTVENLQVSAQDTLYEDSIIQVEYYIHNRGNRKAKASWRDRAVLSFGPGPQSSQRALMDSYSHRSDLLPGDSVKRTFFYKIPSLSESRYHIRVETDINDVVYEHQGEGNNYALSSSFKPSGYYLKRAPSGSGGSSTGGNNLASSLNADLEALQLTAPGSANSGQNITISWQGRSNGPDTLSNTVWNDKLYLSNDTLLDAGDISLLSLGYNQGLLPGQSYSRARNLALPNGISGNYHLLLDLADGLQNSGDSIAGNNLLHQPLSINLSSPVDLIVTNMSLPGGTLYGGQSIWVNFTIKNDGTGNIQNQKIALSSLLGSSPQGLSGSNIGRFDTTISLSSGASFTDSVQVQFPGYAVGNYYLVLKADPGNTIYEHLKEGNNTRSIPLAIQASSNITTDLIPTQITVPDTFWLGRSYQLPYTLVNQGSVKATGTASNGFYFAQGTSFNSSTDRLFTLSPLSVNLQQGESKSGQIGGVLQGVAPGSYYGIARMNVNAGVGEFNFTNNDTTLPSQVVVEAETLLPGNLDSNTLESGDPVYYKVPVTAGKDLLIDLKSFSGQTGVNNLYASFNKLPSASQSDFASTAASLNQQLLVPNTQAGDYYILATGSGNFQQNVAVEAQLLPFSILNIAPDVVGKGRVTTSLNGAGFRQGLNVVLRDDQGQYVDTAQVSQYISSMELQLQWELSNVDTGYYDVVAINPDQSTAVLDSGLKVEESTGFQHFMYVNDPSVIRAGKSGFFTFFVKNDGNIDIPYIKGDISVKAYSNITSFQIPNGNKVFYPTKLAGNAANLSQSNVTDWKENGDAKQLPFVIKDLAPGEKIRINATFKGFISNSFPYRMRSVASNDQLFVEELESNIEKIRQSAIAGYEDSVNSSQVLAWLYDRQDYRDTVIDFYVRRGLLEAGDTTHLTGTCSTCGNGYDFSPGTSPGRSKYNNLNLDAGQTMLWEINHPEGDPGGELGWDVIETVGGVTINATSSNPFEIDLLTLSSWNNAPDFLTTWSPGYDHCWPIVVAGGGISGFAKNKFTINDSAFTNNTPIYGGNFELNLSPGGDTLYLCFRAAQPGVGQDGFPGGSGHYGQDGGRGGPGGPCGSNTPPGDGGRGGSGGHGVGGWLPPGEGGPGGPGGPCSSGSYSGGDGGSGGRGGEGGDGQSGAGGGTGGTGGTGGGSGGSGGHGGDGGNDGAPGPGGPGGPGDDGGPDGPDGPPGDPDDPQDPNEDPDDPNDPNDPNDPPPPPGNNPPPDVPPGGPPGTPPGPGGNPPGPGTPPGPGPGPGPGPAGCSEASSSSPSPCDVWGAANTGAGCASAAAGCGESAGKALVWAFVGGPIGWGLVAVEAGSCALGMYNCSDHGGKFSNCLEAGIDAVSLDPTAPVSGSACAQEILCDETPVKSSCDPNEIVGPEGYGNDHMVAKDERMPYTIYFENDSALATTAAQKVEIRQEVHPNFNPFNLQLTEVGFGDFSFQLPGTPSVTTVLKTSDSLGVDVQLTAGYDVVQDELFWIFQTINPSTGLPPYDPLAGFLPINDSTGAGEGFVNYTITPQTGQVSTGDSLTAQADIIFDINAPIITNTEFNIIDAGRPQSTLDSLAPTQDSVSFPVCWEASDDTGGSGVAAVTLYASENGGPYQQVAQVNYPDTCYQFTGNNLSTYDFAAVAEDNVGQGEDTVLQGPSTLIAASDLRLIAPSDTSVCAADSLSLSWKPGGVDQVYLAIKAVEDSTFTTIAGPLDSLQTPYRYLFPDSLPRGLYQFQVRDTSGLQVNKGDTVQIGKAPQVSLADTLPVCEGDSLQLSATGADLYAWDAHPSIGDTSSSSPWAQPSQSRWYYLQAQDSLGCGIRDSVYVPLRPVDTTYSTSYTCDSAAAGVTISHLNNRYGCDSTVVDTLLLNPSYLIDDSSLSICAGDSALIYGTYRHTAGIYYDSLSTQAGCDSVRRRSLTVLPHKDTTLPVQESCANDSALIAGAYRNSSGTYFDTLSAANGCDSVVSTSLNVLPTASSAQNTSICAGDSVFLAGAYRSSGGTYRDTLAAANGCDSVVTTTLSVLPTSSSSQSSSICAGDSILLGGSYRSSAGTYYDTLTAANGCDSVVSTALSVLPTASSSQNTSICAGDSLLIAGAYRSSAGTFYDTLTASNGCDSVVATTLSVLPHASSSTSSSICAGDSILIGGNYRSTAGTYYDTLTAANGCDSVVSTSLNVLPHAGSSQSTSICAGDSVFLGGSYQNTSGTYYDTLTAANGCDSVVSTSLNVLPTASSAQNTSICAGDSVFLAGAYRSSGGTYRDTLAAANGCDSVVTTTLSVLLTSSSSQSSSICSGDSILLGGSYRSSAGTYYDTLTASNGCDSVVSTALSVLPTANSSQSTSICAGDSVLLGGSYRSTSGTYYDTLTAANGCDSVQTTTLNVLPTSGSSTNTSICNGDSILIAGAYRSTAGTYYDTLTAANGCDSVVSTVLAVLPHASSSQSASICAGDSILLGGSYRRTSGSYLDTLAASNGCDSVVTTNLSVNPVDSTASTAQICQGDSLLLGGSYRTTAGTYIDSLNNRFGCDSLHYTTLMVDQYTQVTDSLEACAGDSLYLEGQWRSSPGLYRDTLAGPLCDTIRSTQLSFYQVDTVVQVIGDTSLQAQNSTADSYQWIDCSNGQLIPGATNPRFDPVNNGLYALVVTENGCTDTSGCYLIDAIDLTSRVLRQLTYHPNPTKQRVQVELGGVYGSVTVTVIDAKGRIMQTRNYGHRAQFWVNLEPYASGEYFLQVQVGQAQRLLKVVKR